MIASVLKAVWLVAKTLTVILIVLLGVVFVRNYAARPDSARPHVTGN